MTAETEQLIAKYIDDTGNVPPLRTAYSDWLENQLAEKEKEVAEQNKFIENLYSTHTAEAKKCVQAFDKKAAKIKELEERIPKKIKPITRTLESFGYANGWNSCIDELTKQS